MSFPVFPAQDLAKLVLGYLMEEQLMTAYDEFLQASPYLDPFTNEYDRLCMLSLKNILAEYRAMRMLVETCKPFILRKCLLQCPSLFEMIRLLINIVDTNKLYKNEESPEKKFGSKSSKPLLSRTTKICDHHTTLAPTEEVMNTEVETTSSADLPGNYETKLTEESSHRKETDFVQKVTSHEMKDVASNNSEQEPVISENSVHNVNKGNRISLSGTFRDFSSGVQGNPGGAAVVAESSTPFTLLAGYPNKPPERTAGQSTDDTDPSTPFSNITVKCNPSSVTGIAGNSAKLSDNPNAPKTSQKVKIISDIKVDDNILRKEFINTQVPIVPILTPQPLRIYINKPSSTGDSAKGFTKDEIMAMPTLILMTTSAPQMVTNTIKTVHTTTEPTTTSTLTQPLSVNVHKATLPSMPDCEVIDLTAGSTRKKTDDSEHLLRVAMGKMPSLPKELTEVDKVCTPRGTKPEKKSSSTPRRTSHIRVLDFNTPRRILQESSSENGTKLPEAENLPKFDINNTAPQSEKQAVAGQNPVNKTKENKKTPAKKFWDSDLRSLVDPTDVKFMPYKPKSSTKSTKALDQSKKVKKKASNSKLSKNGTKSKNSPEENNQNSCKLAEPLENVTVRLTKIEVNDTKVNKSNEKVTPDLERDSLHNAIGSKLNISDLFETPFKQAIYDIQMDTPRFMETEFSDEPISAIKILNMPTPKFLNTSEVPQTPASYCSRPTDYSSGGSYYKPDEQDYIPLPEVLRGSIATSSPLKSKPEDNTKADPTSSKRTSRPVRQCTKNVSYYNSPVIKTNSDDAVKQKCSESSGSGDNKHLPDKVKSKSPNDGECKSENKKRISQSKSPRKGTPKIHNKIKVNNLGSKTSQRSKKNKDSTVSNKDSKRSKSRKTSENKQDSATSVTDVSEQEEPTVVPISIKNGTNVRDFHEELIKRGFDLETAQIIERDFLDEGQPQSHQIEAITEMYNPKNVANALTSSGDSNKDVFDDELEFSVCNFDYQSSNYFVMEHSEGVTSKSAHVSFKNTFCMEVCIEDVEIRLSATEMETLYNETPDDIPDTNKSVDPIEETLCAIHSISNMDKLYTPKKELTRVQAQCLDIFDSTLASLDTPIKSDTPARKSIKEMLEREEDEEEPQEKQAAVTNRKRQRIDSDSDECETKKSKSLIANIQKFDIESVLSKLHGL